MSSASNYASTPNIGSANITAALGGTRATPTGASTLITTGASGSIITRALIQNNQPVASGAPSANVARFYLHNGSTYFLIKEYGFTPTDAAAGTASEPFEVVFNDLVVPTGWTLQGGISVRASDVDDTAITVLAGNF